MSKYSAIDPMTFRNKRIADANYRASESWRSYAKEVEQLNNHHKGELDKANARIRKQKEVISSLKGEVARLKEEVSEARRAQRKAETDHEASELIREMLKAQRNALYKNKDMSWDEVVKLGEAVFDEEAEKLKNKG